MTGADEFRLLILRGVEGRREYILKGDVLELGRPEPGWNPAIPIIAPGVLAHHATLTREGDGYRLDPAPGASVLVNRSSFSGGRLRDGDVLTLGAARFQFWAGGLRGNTPEPGPTAGGEGASSEGASSAHAGAGETDALPAMPRSGRRRALAALLIVAGILLLLILLRSADLGPRP